ncbi:MAG TPA: hypothetical protein VGL86_16820 [Polyangia bacterium]|jgi:hypothetical protein
MKMIAITAALVAAGCVQTGVSGDDADGGTPTTGIYHVTQTTTGNCREVDGSGAGVVFVDDPGTIRVSIFGETFSTPTGGPPVFGWSEEFIDIPDGFLTHTFPTCNAEVQQILTVEAVSADHVRVRRDDTYSGIAGADPTCLPNFIPSSDCTQTTEIDYQLTDPCPSTCIQSDDTPAPPAPLGFRCSC